MHRASPSWLPGALVALAAVVSYLPTLGHALVWDDPALVDLVARAHHDGGLARVASVEFLLDPREPTGYYRPVVLLSLWADRAVGNGAAAAYHATNLLLHAGCSLLLAALAGRLLRSRAAGLVAGVLFAVHPVHVESVAFVAGRTDLWAGLFVLLATLAWAAGRDAAGPRRAALVAASGAALGLALLSKEVAVVLPAALVGWEALVPDAPGRGGRLGRLGPWLAAWAAGGAVAAAARAASGLALVPARAASPASALATDPALLPQVLAKALALLTVPWPLHAFWERDRLAWDPATLAAAALGGAVLAVAARWGERRIAAAGAVWALVFMAPVAGFVPLGAAPFAERFLYLPSAGFCLAAAALVPALRARPRAQAAAACGIAMVTVVLAAASASRARVWHDEVSLFESIVRAAPTSAAMWDNLGQAYDAAGRGGAAERAYREALRLDPRRASAWNGLGVLWGRGARPVDAARAFREAIRLDPVAPHPRFNLALLCLSRGDQACAEEQRAALERLAPEAADRVARAMREPR